MCLDCLDRFTGFSCRSFVFLNWCWQGDLPNPGSEWHALAAGKSPPNFEQFSVECDFFRWSGLCHGVPYSGQFFFPGVVWRFQKEMGAHRFNRKAETQMGLGCKECGGCCLAGSHSIGCFTGRTFCFQVIKTSTWQGPKLGICARLCPQEASSSSSHARVSAPVPKAAEKVRCLKFGKDENARLFDICIGQGWWIHGTKGLEQEWFQFWVLSQETFEMLWSVWKAPNNSCRCWLFCSPWALHTENMEQERKLQDFEHSLNLCSTSFGCRSPTLLMKFSSLLMLESLDSCYFQWNFRRVCSWFFTAGCHGSDRETAMEILDDVTTTTSPNRCQR